MNGGQNRSTQLDLYVDGLLGEQERLQFEARLGADPDLQAELEVQRRIDQALRRMLQPTAAAPLMAPVHGPKERRQRRPRWLAIAAMLLIALGTWRLWTQLRPPPAPGDPYAVPAWQSMEMAYLQQVNTGFTPAWVCENDQQFATAFWDVLGQGMRLDPLPPGLEVAGLSYANVHSPRTMLLLARASGTPIVVFADRNTQRRALALSADSMLHIHTRQVGPLVLHEVSTLPAPRLLGLFTPINMPPEWLKAWENDPALRFPLQRPR